MLRKKIRASKFFYDFRIDDYIPQDHLLRLINTYVDFEFIRKRIKHLYSHTGQPAIDPVVLIKMLLIGYLFNIKSERQLVKEIQVNLAYRWFINYDIDENIPDHSTISQTRRRKFKDSNIFQEIFDEIVHKCISIGLVKGETIITDSTHVKANASYDSLIEIVQTSQEFFDQLDSNFKSGNNGNELSKDDDLNKSSKKRQKRYSNSTHRSKSDPDSRLMSRQGKPKGLHYLEHRSMDSSGYITDVYITPANIQDNTPYIERIKRQKWAFKFPLLNAVADRAYGIGKVYKGLSDMKINAYIEQYTRQDKRDGMFDYDDFKYIKEKDYYICPQGHHLTRRSKEPKEGKCYVYHCGRKLCNKKCPSRNKCIISKWDRPREIKRNIYQDYIDEQLKNKSSTEWRRMMIIRKTKIEGSFADAKNNHGLSKARMRGIRKVQEQSLLIAIVQNIKKMIKYLHKFDKTVPNMIPKISIHVLWFTV